MSKLTVDELLQESGRCLRCKNARCKEHCPINTDIPRIIGLFKEDKIKEAGEILFENNPLSVVCSVICPHESQCRGNCIKGIKGEPVDFASIEYYISRKFIENVNFKQEVNLKDKISIIGSGPAGITLAFILAKKGYSVTIFEKHSKLGGVLRFGIPNFRLDKGILDTIEKRLLELNVKIRYNSLVGPVITLDNMFRDGYKAIFIGTGVWNPKPLNIKGETLGHVNYAIDYLKSPSSFNVGKKVAVIGAGNVAMDAARTANRNGAEVHILYRKGFEEMKATKAEIEEAKKEGVKFNILKAPVEIVDEGIKIISTEKIIYENGRVGTKNIEGTEEIFKCDSVIIAVSQAPKSNIVSSTKNIKINEHGLLVTDEKGHTTLTGVFASGDVVTGAKTVVEAVYNAKIVANSIDEYCKSLK
ncbi:NAD(P)-dependent oxidoreductase [Clostridium niameyense]|uniref:NAD(P)-dependent oxidoreductase n=1 Tax=Clostridium niameyense TaxID=1622073 RepID=A0A6M0RB75_9CLOT|nr:NAD(P)-dependent oxidoreductase [Clostridium niameyense]NEZ46438.1 NAD(P)-dependent oxidoreductase [Clostridium niameyense]